MKSIHLLIIPAICMLSLQSCDKAVANEKTKDATSKNNDATKNTSKQNILSIDLNNVAYSDTKGMGNAGDIFTSFDCPDASSFPPIDIKSWDKTTVVNGRLPTYEETHNGTSIHHYGGQESNLLKVYRMNLPRLATIYNKRTKQQETVVVIQIVCTPKDTVVGYRYLTGGCGGSAFRDFHFLTVPEIKQVTGRSKTSN
jgi:hypothetical protein